MKVPSVCACCLVELHAKKPDQRFCSSRCRLLYWAAGALLGAFRAGRADGLKDRIRELSEAAK